MTDALPTSIGDRKRRLSVAYTMAVAAQAGYRVDILDSDRDGVDLRIDTGKAFRPALDISLQATTLLEPPKAGCTAYSLPSCRYERLRMKTQTPRILIVLDLPKQEDRWSSVNFNELVLRHRAYWLSLKDHDPKDIEEISNMHSVRIDIPMRNLFNAASLQRLMALSRTGDI
ncbi:DUF4365 domain-containing protein [Thioalkalivibrio sp. HK1]|uniref:DUF4365 domain-containing protein n=1 Tax=Thioalkalivibrio sp. HK1 TaxID=1469245 RepID=UPI0004719CEB|nr:DUF4365 domain-containing protein [Thioalkalivibrio sp. HK1]